MPLGEMTRRSPNDYLEYSIGGLIGGRWALVVCGP